MHLYSSAHIILFTSVWTAHALFSFPLYQVRLDYKFRGGGGGGGGVTSGHVGIMTFIAIVATCNDRYVRTIVRTIFMPFMSAA